MLEEVNHSVVDELREHPDFRRTDLLRKAIIEKLDLALQIGTTLGDALEGEALSATEDRGDLARRELHNLRDLYDRTDRIEVFQAWVFDTRITLSDDTEVLMLLLSQTHHLHRLLATDEDGHEGTWEDRHIAQGDQRVQIGLLCGLEVKDLIFAVGS